MKALLTCPTCGYQILGMEPDPDASLKAALAGMQRHQETAHAVPMTPDRFLTALRMGNIH